MSVRRRFLLSIVLLLAAGTAAAQDVESKARELQQTRQQLETSRQRSERLRKNLGEMEGALASLQKETGSIAAELKETEQRMHVMEERLSELEGRKAEKERLVARRQKEIGALLAAVLRISQVPPHAVLVRHDGLEAQIHASRALGVTTRSIKEEMDGVALQLTEIAMLQREIAGQQEKLTGRQQELQQRRDQLARRVEERRTMMEGLHTEEMREQEVIAGLTRQSSDLESLVESLEAARDNQRSSQFDAIGVPIFKPAPPARGAGKRVADAIKAVKPAAPSRQRREYDLAKAKGALALPVAGHIAERYGRQRASNDTLRGMMMETAGGATVTVPYGGEVIFTGPFLDYGKMVIVRHSRRYHTLLAGLQRIDVAPGQFLLEGEPIGVMGDDRKDRRLYVELRENGKPVDPAPWYEGGRRLAKN